MLDTNSEVMRFAKKINLMLNLLNLLSGCEITASGTKLVKSYLL